MLTDWRRCRSFYLAPKESPLEWVPGFSQLLGSELHIQRMTEMSWNPGQRDSTCFMVSSDQSPVWLPRQERNRTNPIHSFLQITSVALKDFCQTLNQSIFRSVRKDVGCSLGIRHHPWTKSCKSHRTSSHCWGSDEKDHLVTVSNFVVSRWIQWNHFFFYFP